VTSYAVARRIKKSHMHIPVVSRRRRVPAGAEDIQGFAVNIIVHQTRIDAKRSHQKNYVPASEEYVPDLSIFVGKYWIKLCDPWEQKPARCFFLSPNKQVATVT